MKSSPELQKTILDETAKSLERRLNSLKIFALPLETAIVYLLRIIEDRSRLPMLAAMSKGKSVEEGVMSAHALFREGADALSVLLPLIYERCRSIKKISLQNYNEGNYSCAGIAIEVAHTYAQIKSVLHLVNIGVYSLVKKKSGVYFIPSRGSINYDARAQIINFSSLKSEMSIPAYLPPSSFQEMLRPHLAMGISTLIKQKKSGSFVDKIPTQISNELNNMIEGILQKKWTLIDSIRLGAYSIRDAKKMWAALLKLCIFHDSVAFFSGLPGMGMEYLPIVMNENDLINFLSQHSGTSKEETLDFISDLTFNKKVITDEIMFQPFLPVADTPFLIFSPHIISFSSPERNLMKLWAKRYPGPYGAKIANQGTYEEKHLATEIKKSNSNFLVINSKKIKSGKRILTDIDVAVYDKLNREALFIQLKWCMQPDSAVEVRNTDGKLNKGIEQLKVIAEYLKSHMNGYQEFFGSGTESPKKVFMCVVSSSSGGSFWAQKEYEIFNEGVILKSLSGNIFSSIAKMYKSWQVFHTFKPQIHFRSVFQAVSFNGMKYFLPATQIHDDKNIIKKAYRLLKYLFFSVIARDHYMTWRKVKNPLFFTKEGH